MMIYLVMLLFLPMALPPTDSFSATAWLFIGKDLEGVILAFMLRLIEVEQRPTR